MKAIRNLGNRLNSAQKLIVSIVIPAILLVIATAWADEVGSGPFDWDDTWAIWVLFFALVGYFEYNLFSDKK